jgi:hypothetical protein
MNNGQGSIFGGALHGMPQTQLEFNKHFNPAPPEVVIQTLHEMANWVPMTNQTLSVIQNAVGLISRLQQDNKAMSDDKYWKLRKFGEEMLALISIPADAGREKRVFFHDFETGEVYLGFPAVMGKDIPPIVMKATLGVEAVVTLSLNEAVEATKKICNTFESWVYGTGRLGLNEEVPLNPLSGETELDWEFTMDLGDSLFENDFKASFIFLGEQAHIVRPDLEYDTFKDKFNLCAILNGPNRSVMRLRVFSINQQQYYEWVFPK